MVSDLESPAKYSIVHDFVMTWDGEDRTPHFLLRILVVLL